MEPEIPYEPDGIHTCVDQVAARFAKPPLDREIASARAEFDLHRGAVCDDEELYQGHMAAFLEWYVLERPQASGDPPVVAALRERPGDPLLRALALSYHSVFEVLDPVVAGPPGVRLLDLTQGGTWRVDHEPMDGLARGDIFEARLVPWGGRVRFGPVFCFHPRPARESIHALAGRARDEGWLGRELVDALAQMRLKHCRCRNIPVTRIYAARSFGGRSG
jgi:hypothetical protein